MADCLTTLKQVVGNAEASGHPDAHILTVDQQRGENNLFVRVCKEQLLRTAWEF